MNVTSDTTAVTNRGEREVQLTGACLPADTAGAAGLAIARPRWSNPGYRALRGHTPPARASLPAPRQTALKNVIKIVVAFISKDLQNLCLKKKN